MAKYFFTLTLALFLSACAEQNLPEASPEHMMGLMRGATSSAPTSEVAELTNREVPEFEQDDSGKARILVKGSLGRGIRYIGASQFTALYTATYSELNQVLGAPVLRPGTFHYAYLLFINSAAGRWCRSQGWTGGGDLEWVNIPWSEATFACFHGQTHNVGSYVFPSIGINLTGQIFGPDHPIFTAAAASRFARNMGYGGGVLQEYTPNAMVFSTPSRTNLHNINLDWGRTYGYPAWNSQDYYRYIHAEHFAGHFCRVNGWGVSGKIVELNGATAAAVLQCVQ